MAGYPAASAVHRNELTHRRSIAEGLLQSLSSGERALRAATDFLYDSRSELLTEEQAEAELTAIVEAHNRLEEMSYVGNPQVRVAWGGANPAAAGVSESKLALAPTGHVTGHDKQVDAVALRDGTFNEPPNLRESSGWEKCGTCVFFDGKMQCLLYGWDRQGKSDIVHRGGYPVGREDICDSYATLTEPERRVTIEEARLARAEAVGDSVLVARAKARLDIARKRVSVTSALEEAIRERRKHDSEWQDRNGKKREYSDRELTLKEMLDWPYWKGEAADDQIAEVTSRAYPSLERSPRENWVEQVGGLPSYIERIAKHLHYERGHTISKAIQIAVGVVKRWCAGGSVSTRGGVSAAHVTAATRAKACKAVAEWEAKKARSKGKRAARAAGRAVREDVFDIALGLVEAEEVIKPPTAKFAGSVIEAVELNLDSRVPHAELGDTRRSDAP